ncbi:hypothetical protein ACIGXF_37805 [Streptomyces sp. NPDC053086]|uniref:hypothetical protein n=1 Tax=unclassified Streptomyces TaxID=2593676 RepID=UPI0037D613E0
METDVLSGFALARASVGLAGGTIRGDAGHLEQIRTWFGRPLRDIQPADGQGLQGGAFMPPSARGPSPPGMRHEVQRAELIET